MTAGIHLDAEIKVTDTAESEIDTLQLHEHFGCEKDELASLTDRVELAATPWEIPQADEDGPGIDFFDVTIVDIC